MGIPLLLLFLPATTPLWWTSASESDSAVRGVRVPLPSPSISLLGVRFLGECHACRSGDVRMCGTMANVVGQPVSTLQNTSFSPTPRPLPLRAAPCWRQIIYSRSSAPPRVPSLPPCPSPKAPRYSTVQYIQYSAVRRLVSIASTPPPPPPPSSPQRPPLCILASNWRGVSARRPAFPASASPPSLLC